MKRVLSAFLAILLLLGLAACGKQPATTPEPSTSAVTGFVPPDNYVSVLVVSINPQFRLYLDADGMVLAAEPMNEDAKAMEEKLAVTNKNVQDAITNLVTAAKDQGFVKEDAKISVQLTESKNPEIDSNTLLSQATDAVTQAAAALQLEVEVEKEDARTPENTTPPETTAPAETTAPPETTAPTQPSHTHKFSKATCTKPKTCKCGETEGKALGHDYKDGFCSRCDEKDPSVTFTPIAEKFYKWTGKCVNDKEYYSISLLLSDPPMMSYSIGDHLSTLPPEAQEEMKAECVKFDGEYYYVARGDGDDLSSVTEKDDVITVKDSAGNKLVLTRTGEDKLKVKSCDAGFGGMGKIAKSTVFTYTED